jgi:hypothetical protein
MEAANMEAANMERLDGTSMTGTQGSRRAPRLWRGAAALGLALGGLVVPAGAAVAAEYPDGGASSSTVRSDPGDPGVEVAGRTQTRGSMPFTGGDVAALAAIGGGAVAIGGVLVSQSRRSRRANPTPAS